MGEDVGSPAESLKRLLLSMAGVHGCADLLAQITQGLAREPAVALARIWLLQPGDDCAACPQRTSCPTLVPCLHLVASAGSGRGGASKWTGTDGAFRRIPVGVRRIGKLVTDGPIRLDDVGQNDAWVADPAWAEEQGIRGFGGVPLRHRGDTLGALGVFTREPFGEERLDWLKLIGDHASAAIATARAFEENAELKAKLERENAYLREEVAAERFGEIIAQSEAMQRALEAVRSVAPTDASVLITGESGTGKELVARAIHEASERRDRPLVKVNCASVPSELFESEFFGHVRGAFTGAASDRAGRFALAHEGTLFLDEVAEIPLALQSKLLRVLQEGEYERVGEERTSRVDVRIVAATNRDLEREVNEGRFRQDLYYRLNVFPIHVASLRERPEDVLPLARHFITRAAPRLRRPVLAIQDDVASQLVAYAWPGNVRELHNVIERALILSGDGPLRLSLPSSHGGGRDSGVWTDAEMKERERDNVERALARCEGRIYGPGGAAELLGMKPTTLASRMKKLGIDKP